MQTTHERVVGDARSMDAVDDGSVELVVTSPPYPMIEMWDGAFAALDGRIDEALEDGDGDAAFELMHAALDDAWAEVERVLREGGVACVNVGDATRSVGGRFRLYPNHARIVEAFRGLGFDPLPPILWRKPTNSPTKFMGSGMLPPNAYVTLEHEHILVFRKGEPRSFEPGARRRYEAAYTWEERNRWFSDLWEGVRGERQVLEDDDLRRRSGAFPFAIPYRLINMYSVYGDTVLDPFWGTGTTSLAAMVAGRNSIGYEIERELASVFERRVDGVEELSRRVVRDRIDDHLEFAGESRRRGRELEYEAANYGFPVRTEQEREIQLYVVEGFDERDGTYRLAYSKSRERSGPDSSGEGSARPTRGSDSD